MNAINLIATSFPGIISSSPEILIPMFLIAAAFGLSGLIGLSIGIRDWFVRRS